MKIKEIISIRIIIVIAIYLLSCPILLIPSSNKELIKDLSIFDNDRDRIEYIISKINDFDFDFTPNSIFVLDTLQTLIKKNNYDEYLAELYQYYGVYWQIKADYLKSTKYLTDALKEAERLGDQHLIGRVSRQLGENYRATNDYDRALSHLKKAEKIFEELKDSLYLARTYNRYAAIMYQDYQNHPFTDAVRYALRSNDIALAKRDTSLIVNNYNILGACYNGLNDFEKAIDYLQKAISLSDSIDSVEYPNYLNNIAHMYYRKGEFEKSIDYALKAYELALDRGLIHSLTDISMILAFCYDTLKDYKNAYYFKTMQLNNFDSLFKASKRQAILEFEEKYENKKKEQIIHSQEMHQRYQLIVFIIILISFFMIILVYIKKQKQLKKVNTELSDLNKKISEQNEELSNLNQTKDKFFSIIAHDLKNPIAALRNLTEIIVDEYESLEDREKLDFIKEIKNTSSNLFELLEDLLVWSRSQSGKIDFNPVKIDLCYITKSNIDLMRMSARRKNIELIAKGECPCFATIDVNMITTVIRNLISNSIKFTNKDGKIIISHSEDESNIYISIKDNGVGMEDSTRKYLFRIDSNISTIGTDNERGTGLGLIVSKEFVEKHGGTINVESELGIGSNFIVTLPKSKEDR
jgi:signal transduction histidine kinase